MDGNVEASQSEFLQSNISQTPERTLSSISRLIPCSLVPAPPPIPPEQDAPGAGLVHCCSPNRAELILLGLNVRTEKKACAHHHQEGWAGAPAAPPYSFMVSSLQLLNHPRTGGSHPCPQRPPSPSLPSATRPRLQPLLLLAELHPAYAMWCQE